MSKVHFDFDGENFAVTGASSGIGRQIAIDLADAGANVLAIARNVERLDEVRNHNSARIVTASVDVCDPNALEEAIKNFVGSHGKLNGGVHAAGITGYTSLKNFDRDFAHRIMATSFWAAVDFTRLITKSKYGAGGSSIVLFSSVASDLNPKAKFAYAASKSAVNNFVKTVAKEICAKRHRINSVMPGWISTPMTTAVDYLVDVENETSKFLLGEGTPADVSSTVMFLLSDGARWITGTNIAVDGGRLA